MKPGRRLRTSLVAAAVTAATIPATIGCFAPLIAATPANAEAGQVHAFTIGTLHAWALKDGDIDVPNDGKTFGVGHPSAEVSAMLSKAGLPSDTFHLSVEPLLVRAGARLLLFDTGAGSASFARAGRLPVSLKAAGVKAAAITDIFISHSHPDHVGGLLTKDGSLAFPNAAIHMSAAEWSAMQGDASEAAIVNAIRPKVLTFEPGAEIFPGLVKAVDSAGHTPGHSSYEITSGTARLLYIGDVVHHPVISVGKPDWQIAWEADDAAARAVRMKLLDRASADGERVYASHFPFPGVGRIQKEGSGFTWKPEP